MHRRLAALMLSMVLGADASLAQTSQIVEFEVKGEAVVGTLTLPKDGPAPVVLLLHGFTGSRDELLINGTEEGVFTRTARLLREGGYASLRIDFRGSGESGGKWEDTTFRGQIRDAVAAVDWLKDSDQVDGERIAVLGWSQGGLIAAHTAMERPEVKSAILWAPVVHPLHTFEALLGAKTTAEALDATPDTPILAKLPWGAEITLKARFYQQLALSSTAAAVAAYDGPLKVIVGAEDMIVAPQPASGQVLLDYHNGPELLSVFETDHVWSAFEGPEVIDEQMLPATLKWLDSYM